MPTKRLLAALSAAALAAVTACVPPPAPTPAPAPTPTSTPSPRPVPPPPQPAFESWMDAPQTPGDWFYVVGSNETSANFGPTADRPMFAMTCSHSTVTLNRLAGTKVPVPALLTIRTESQDRTLTAIPGFAGVDVHASISAADPFLDAIAYSKGRFAVEVSGVPTLYLPSWPEITRVIEDCR